LPNYAELEQILLFSVNWGKQVWIYGKYHHIYLLDKCVGVDPDWNDLILTIYLLDKCVDVDPDWND
jgi:hypothetical protein